MKKLILTGMSAGLLALLSDSALAHGGQYRGPGDVVPPAPGGGGGRSPGAAGPTTGGPAGPATPGPAGPATPGPAGPGTGGPAGPAGPKGPTTGGGGVAIGDDLTRWEFWWEFNKDPFIRLKDAIHTDGVTSGSDDFFMGTGRRRDARNTLKPTDRDILETILPKLKEAMEVTDQRDINSSCLIAMGKIGKNKGEEINILEIMKAKLVERDQEIRETAALAMGISQMTAAVDDLAHLVGDSPKGRELVDRSDVDDRTRTFSAYALGLIAHASPDTAVKQKALDALSTELAKKDIVSRNIKVALINGIALINPDVFEQGDLAQGCIKALKEYYMQPLGAGEQLIQAHCPPAVAKILGDSGPDGGWWQEARDEWKELLHSELIGRSAVKRSANEIAQSAVLTLGQLCDPVNDRKDPDFKYAKALLDYFNSGKDLQTKYFSLMAKGQMGGNINKSDLMIVLDKGQKATEKPWAAIALGVLNFEKFEEAEAMGRSVGTDTELGLALERNLMEVKNPTAQGAFAVALGLCKYKEAADAMRDMLVKNAHKEDIAGYLCIGLALMDDRRSIEDIREIVGNSVRRPDLLKQAAIALGKLGDKSVAEQLQTMMREGDSNLAKMSAIASALGFIGDRRTIDPLVEMLFDENLTDLSRAFAAVALGGVADKESLPWNSKIGVDMNYRAAVETLTNGSVGILDIL